MQKANQSEGMSSSFMWGSIHVDDLNEADRIKGTISEGEKLHYMGQAILKVQGQDKKFSAASVKKHIREMEAFIEGDSDWTDHDEQTLVLSQCDPRETSTTRVAHEREAHVRMKEEMRSFDTHVRKIHKYMRYVDGERPTFNGRLGHMPKNVAKDARPWATIDRDDEYKSVISSKVHNLKIQQQFAQAGSPQAKAAVAIDVDVTDAASVLRMMPASQRKEILRYVLRQDREDDTDVCRDIRKKLTPRLDIHRDNDDGYEA